MKNELSSLLNDPLNDLTPEERRLLAEATPQDWVEAAKELAKELAQDPNFWGELAEAFIDGLLKR